MDTVFSLSYPEYCVSTLLQDSFPRKEGFSVFIPLSRQEPGIDVVLMHRNRLQTKAATIQIKASRTYEGWDSDTAKNRRFRYYTWFNTFAVSNRADWYLLVGIWPPRGGRTKKVGFRWQHMVLAFTRNEMTRFLKTIKTRGGNPDSMFEFAFDEPTRVFQGRGDPRRRFREYSHWLFQNRIAEIQRSLG